MSPLRPMGHLEPHVSNLPRRMVVKRRTIVEGSESSTKGNAKRRPARLPSSGGESRRQHSRIQPLGEGTDVFVSLDDVEDCDGITIRVEDEGENDRGVMTLSRSAFLKLMTTASGKVPIVGRVNAFTVALGILSRRSRRDVIKTYVGAA
ncbi:hypothetical protein DFS33DRAFT_1269030 [Desarmillaria ectypa]|nr:hypothetical protein DFS33DRAFT_1269030 [Desarmillaria ectypa]